MTYQPRTLEGWESEIAFTVAEAPFDQVAPVAAGVIRARQGPSGEIVGERRPPMMALAEMQAAATAGQADPPGIPVFQGVLIFSPAEAPHLTVIEHPLDFVGPAGLPEDLAKVLDTTRLYTFDSSLETANRQHHGLSLRQGERVLRRATLSRGYESRIWDWEETGDPLAIEDPARLAKKRIWERLDRALIFDYAERLGLDPAKSLFGRTFAQSVYYHPLAFDEPAAEDFLTDTKPYDAFAAGVRSTIGLDIPDKDFAERASLTAAFLRWERAIDKARCKAWESESRARTPAGRERAQWRLVNALREVTEDMQGYDLDFTGINWYFSTLDEPMRQLGRDTEAYRVFRGLCRKPFWMFWRR